MRARLFRGDQHHVRSNVVPSIRVKSTTRTGNPISRHEGVMKVKHCIRRSKSSRRSRITISKDHYSTGRMRITNDVRKSVLKVKYRIVSSRSTGGLRITNNVGVRAAKARSRIKHSKSIRRLRVTTEMNDALRTKRRDGIEAMPMINRLMSISTKA